MKRWKVQFFNFCATGCIYCAGEKGEDLTDTWLVIHDASKLEEGETTLRFKHRLESTLGDSGLLLLNSTDLELGQVKF